MKEPVNLNLPLIVVDSRKAIVPAQETTANGMAAVAVDTAQPPQHFKCNDLGQTAEAAKAKKVAAAEAAANEAKADLAKRGAAGLSFPPDYPVFSIEAELKNQEDAIDDALNSVKDAPLYAFLEGDDQIKLWKCIRSAQRLKDAKDRLENAPRLPMVPPYVANAMRTPEDLSAAAKDHNDALADYASTGDSSVSAADRLAFSNDTRPLLADLGIGLTPVVGQLDAVQQAGSHIQQGEYGAAIVTAAGLIPVGKIGRGIGRIFGKSAKVLAKEEALAMREAEKLEAQAVKEEERLVSKLCDCKV